MHFVNAKGILSASNGMNVYRGCTHGCIYCDSRSRCYHIDHAFEDIEVKQNAPQLLEDALRRKRRKCMISTGAMCDPYMHCEETVGLTRQCLQVIDRYGFGLAIQTKSDRVLRDLPLLKSIHQKAKCVVQITLTTADDSLCRLIEPNVCPTSRRAQVLRILRDEGIPTVVERARILPPQSLMGPADDKSVKTLIVTDEFDLKYRESVDRESAFEILTRANEELERQRIAAQEEEWFLLTEELEEELKKQQENA